MLAAIAQAENELQAILKRGAANIGATKAALYLSHDGQPYELVTQLGFNVPPRRQINSLDIIIDRILTRKSGYWINGQTADQKFYDILYHAGSDRILIMPIFVRSQLVGFVDLRDKEARQPFKNSDFVEAKELVDRLLEFLAARKLFGLETAPVAVATETEPGDASAIAKNIERARATIQRTLETYIPRAKTLSESEIAAASVVLPTILTLPNCVLAAFTAFGHMGNVQHVAARSTLTDAGAEAFDLKLKTWLQKDSQIDSAGGVTRVRTVYPFGESSRAVDAEQIASVLSAPINVADVRGLVLSVAFDRPPDHLTRESLETFLTLIRQTLQHSMSHLNMRTMRQKFAERIMEPDFQKYPELVDHCRRVASLADQFSRYLKLPPEQVEVIRLSAFLHDVGMRVLDYRRIYTKKSLTEDDLKLVHEHPSVGAALIVDSPLGEEIANIVLCHHERPDGKGYPRGLAGEQIPLASRIVHICEAFDAMTAIQSYQEPVPESAALVQITRGAGTQFDIELARRFVEMLQGAGGFVGA
jgi:hypothetical protein